MLDADRRHARAHEAAQARYRAHRLRGGHVDRPIEAMIAAGRFELAELERSYSAGPRVGAYLYRGVARIGAPGAWHPRA